MRLLECLRQLVFECLRQLVFEGLRELVFEGPRQLVFDDAVLRSNYIVNVADFVFRLPGELVAGVDIALGRNGDVGRAGAAARDALKDAGALRF